MNTLQITVDKKIATYNERDGVIICGNSDYQIKFIFDEEWAGQEKKTARFEWNARYHDAEFEGDTCPVPVITNADQCHVGVYVGEAPESATLLSSTRATIKCQRSVRCGAPTASNGTGENYTNEARGYAAEAKEAAKTAEDAAAEVAKAGGMKQVATLTIPLNDFGEVNMYDENGMDMGWCNFPKIGGCMPEGERMLLLEKHEYDNGTTSNALLSQLHQIFNARLVCISVYANDATGLLTPLIYKETIGSVMTWGGKIGEYSMDHLPSDTYVDVTHTIWSDNPDASPEGSGVYAEYLALSKGLYNALATVGSCMDNTPEDPVLVFTAYN